MAAAPLPSKSQAERVAPQDLMKAGRNVARGHDAAGWMISGFEEKALLVSVVGSGFPVIGASVGFCEYTGQPLKDIVGMKVSDALTKGAPPQAVSRSSLKNLQDFCEHCRGAESNQLSLTSVTQARAAAGGGHVLILSLMGMVEVRRRQYVLVVQEKLGDSLFARTLQSQTADATEVCRKIFGKIRTRLGGRQLFTSNESSLGSGSDSGSLDSGMSSCSEAESELLPGRPSPPRIRRARRREHTTIFGHRRESVLEIPSHRLPPFGFFRDRLQEHCILSADGFTATRRESKDLHSGCMVYSDRPVPASARGLEFAIRINSVIDSFEGLPLLGFTQKKPVDQQGLYPTVATCLGRSALIGRNNTAYARDQEENFKIGFRAPPKTEVETFTSTMTVPSTGGANGGGIGAEPSPVISGKPNVGDVIGCVYTWDGRLQLWYNGKLCSEFDIGRPVQREGHYYAVIDVCLSAGSCTLLPQEDSLLPTAGMGRNYDSECSSEDNNDVCSEVLPRPTSRTLFTDLRGPLAPLMSVGDLSTIECDFNGLSGGSPPASSMHTASSLPSLDMDIEERGHTFVKEISNIEEANGEDGSVASGACSVGAGDEDSDEDGLSDGEVSFDSDRSALEEDDDEDIEDDGPVYNPQIAPAETVSPHASAAIGISAPQSPERSSPFELSFSQSLAPPAPTAPAAASASAPKYDSEENAKLESFVSSEPAPMIWHVTPCGPDLQENENPSSDSTCASSSKSFASGRLDTNSSNLIGSGSGCNVGGSSGCGAPLLRAAAVAAVAGATLTLVILGSRRRAQ